MNMVHLKSSSMLFIKSSLFIVHTKKKIFMWKKNLHVKEKIFFFVFITKKVFIRKLYSTRNLCGNKSSRTYGNNKKTIVQNSKEERFVWLFLLLRHVLSRPTVFSSVLHVHCWNWADEAGTTSKMLIKMFIDCFWVFFLLLLQHEFFFPPINRRTELRLSLGWLPLKLLLAEQTPETVFNDSHEWWWLS